jgi:putative CocE/NonD family hydrolase
MEPRHDVLVLRDVRVPARDGVALSTDVYLPSQGGGFARGPFPAILIRTPYDKRAATEGPFYADLFVPRGYAVACQDVRGLHRSEGSFGFLPQEGSDGADTVEWIAAQSWCDGKVGTIGCSYRAWAQTALALERPPHLAAMFVQEGGVSAHAHTIRNGGALEMRWLCWPFWNLAAAHPDPAVREALNRFRGRELFEGGRPFRRGETPLARAPEIEALFWEIYTRGAFDEFWDRPSWEFLSRLGEHADVPVLIVSGWYDSYARAAVEMFDGLRRRLQSEVRLIMGPWVHGTLAADVTFAGEVEFGPAARLGFADTALAWFDRHLKSGTKKPGFIVRLFLMGGGPGGRDAEGRIRHGGAWREAEAWPPPGAQTLTLHLHPGGRLAPERPAGADGADASTSFDFDPARPVPTIGGNLSSHDELRPPAPHHPRAPAADRERVHLGHPGAWDQREREGWVACDSPGRPLADRPDVLVFQTEPLERDVEICGPLQVELWVSTDAPDTDWTAKLVDVYPDGTAINLADGIRRLRFAADPRRETFVKPGRIVRVVVEPYPTANLFRAGHRVRLDVSSSNYPRFDVNPNTGEPLWEHTATRVARNTVHHSTEYPSRLVAWAVHHNG